jgi:chromosome segregation ATPase
MIFKKISYQGYNNTNGTINFDNSLEGLTVFASLEEDYVAKLLNFLLFSSQDLNCVTAPAAFVLEFEIEDKAYRICRNFKKENDQTVEICYVTDGQNNVLLEGENGIRSFLYGIPFAKNNLQSLVFADAQKALSLADAGGDKRDEKIRALYNDLAGLIVSKERIEFLKEKQIKFLNMSKAAAQDGDQAKPDAILEQLKQRLEAVKTEIRYAYASLAQAGEFSPLDNPELKQKLTQTEKELQKEKAVLAKKQKEYEALHEEFVKVSGEIAPSEEFVAGLEAKWHAADFDLKDFIYKSSIDPKHYQIYEKLGPLFATSYEEVGKLSERHNELIDEANRARQFLNERYELLSSVKLCADSKSGVADAVKLETKIVVLEQDIVALDGMLQETLEERDTLAAELVDKNAYLVDLTAMQEALQDRLLSGGESQTIEEAVNLDSVRKQTAYTKHLMLSVYETQYADTNERLHFFTEKEKSASFAFDSYKNKLNQLKTHHAKLNEKLATLKDEYIISQTADALSYGDRCPLCDNAAMTKATKKGTASLKEQVETLQKEVARVNEAMDILIGDIGRAEASKKSYSLYTEALSNTLLKLKLSIEAILQQYQVNSSEELYMVVESIVEESNDLTRCLDLFRKNEAAFCSAQEAVARISERLLKLDNDILPRLRTIVAERINECDYAIEEHSTIQSILGETVGEQTLENLKATEYEAQALEQDIMDAHARLDEIYCELQDIDNFITTLSSRDMPVLVGGVEMPFMEAVVKLIMTDLNALMACPDQLDSESERVMSSVDKTRSYLDHLQHKMFMLQSELTPLESAVASKEGLVSELVEQFSKKEVKKGEEVSLSEAETAEIKSNLSELERNEQELLDKIALLENETKAVHARAQQAAVAKSHADYIENRVIWLEKNIALLPAEDKEIDTNAFYEAFKEEADNYVYLHARGKYRITLDDSARISLANPKFKTKDTKSLADKEADIFEKAVTAALSNLLFKMCGSNITPLFKV